MRAGSSLKDEAREREMCFYNINGCGDEAGNHEVTV